MATRRTYSKAFKIEAVRLLGLGEKPAAQLALELGIRRISGDSIPIKQKYRNIR